MRPLVLPLTVDDLVDMLDTRAFSLRNLPATASPYEIHRHFGARDVIDFLRSLQRERDELIREASINIGEE